MKRRRGNDDGLKSPAWLGKQLDCSVKTARGLINRGDIPFIWVDLENYHGKNIGQKLKSAQFNS